MAKSVQFLAALADGKCLTFDREGEAKLTIAISQAEAAKLAGNLKFFQHVSFRVTLTPVKGA